MDKKTTGGGGQMSPPPACLELTVHVNQGLFVNWQYISAKMYNSYLIYINAFSCISNLKKSRRRPYFDNCLSLFENEKNGVKGSMHFL